MKTNFLTLKADFLTLKIADIGKGFVVAAFAAIGIALLPILQSGSLPTLVNLQAAGTAGLAAGIAYLIKNYFTNSNNRLFASEKNETSTVVSIPKVALPEVNNIVAKVDSTVTLPVQP